MRTRFIKRGQSAFSLVELMVVVAIIGILAALAVPKFKVFQAKARQTEAKNNLSHIYTLEESYYGDNEMYGTTGQIGFATSGMINGQNTTRYGYGSVVGGGGTTFLATATEMGGLVFNKTDCAGIDTWTIDQTKALNNLVNSLATCM